MWYSTTLPRPRPMDPPPPPPPHLKSATLMRNRGNGIGGGMGTGDRGTVDVNRLKSDIEVLSQQLEMVKARLESALADREDSDEGVVEQNPLLTTVKSLSRDNSVDSRTSTALLSTHSDSNNSYTPTPFPTENVMRAHSRIKSMSTTHLAPQRPMQNFDTIQNKRFSMCFPSSSSSFVPVLKRRETFSKVDEITKELQAKLGRVKRTESLSVGRLHDPAPPKPVRTFVQDGTMNRGPNYKFKSSTSSFMSSSVAFLSMCNHKEFVEAINKRFTQGQCWFSRGGQLYFVNPFNNVTSSRCSFYSVIPSITSSLFESKSSTLFLRGVSGSGKSHIAELVCLDIVNRLDNQGQLSSLFKTALTVLRPFLSANNPNNNQCSNAVLHYVFQTRDNRLNRIVLRHFPIKSMSRGCRANIFAMVANDLSEVEKEKYRIAGFRLRENCSSYGNFDDVRMALHNLGIDVADILKIVSSCILLNNLSFNQTSTGTDVENIADLEDACHLLEVSALAMYRYMVSDAQMDSRIIRDNFVTALYSRTVKYIIDKINALLDIFPDAYDRTSVITDSGVSVGTFNDNSHTIHIVDVPGYVRNTQNSLNEFIVNATNDIVQGTDSEMIHKMLQSIGVGTRNQEDWKERSHMMLKHCSDYFEINYDPRLMIERNTNILPRDLISIFDYRSCSFQFGVNLFSSDVECIIIDDNFIPSAVSWPYDGKSIVENVIECIKKLKKEIADTSCQQIICLKSNESLEYARVHENGLGYQLDLYRSVFANVTSLSESRTSRCVSMAVPRLPSPRQYTIRDGRKHHFPQRRNILIDFQDPTSGVMLRAGEIVKAIGFNGECYLVENARRARATIPLSFTEKCVAISHN